MFDFLHNDTIHHLKSALQLQLPGEKAHRKFLPPNRSLALPPDKIQKVKQSAVMVLIVGHRNTLSLLLTLRNHELRHHPGQISFPGGQIDNGEQNIEAALRELEEETGIKQQEVTVCGHLSDLYIPASNFLIHPAVGYINHCPAVNTDSFEVEKILFPRLESFFNESNKVIESVKIPQGHIDVPAYAIDGLTIWGATAMIIAEFTELLTTYARLME